MNDSTGNVIVLQLRPGYNLRGRAALVEDKEPEPESVLKKGERPAKRAVAMANALMFEHALLVGRFPSVTEACKAYGITRRTATRFFRLLNQSPEQIADTLREKY